MSTYRYVDRDGDRLEIRSLSTDVIKIDSFDAVTEHRVIIAVPIDQAEELIAGIRAAVEASNRA